MIRFDKINNGRGHLNFDVEHRERSIVCFSCQKTHDSSKSCSTNKRIKLIYIVLMPSYNRISNDSRWCRCSAIWRSWDSTWISGTSLRRSTTVLANRFDRAWYPDHKTSLKDHRISITLTGGDASWIVFPNILLRFSPHFIKPLTLFRATNTIPIAG